MSSCGNSISNKFSGDEDKMKAFLENHFISEKAIKYMEQNEYDNFIADRQNTIKEKLVRLLD